MKRNEILDSGFEERKGLFLSLNSGMILILVSILVETWLYFSGSYISSCGMNLEDIFIMFVSAIITVFGYQKLRLRFKKNNWILIIIGCAINTLLGIGFYTTIC